MQFAEASFNVQALAADIHLGSCIIRMWLRSEHNRRRRTGRYWIRYLRRPKPYGGLSAQSDDSCLGSICNLVVEFDECDCLLRIRSLDWNNIDERYEVDGTPQGYGQVYVDVQWNGRQHDPVCDHNRQHEFAHHLYSAHNLDQCRSEHRPERWQHHAHLDLDRRNVMHGLRRLVRNRSGQWFAKHRGCFG